MKTRDALKKVHPGTIIAGLGEICKEVLIPKPSFRNLLLSVIAVCVSPTFRLNAIASRLPIRVRHVKSKQKRFYRFLDTVFPIEAVTCAWGRFVLQRLWCQKQSGCNPLVLVDETDLPGGWKAIVASVAFRHRAIPIFWRVYSDAELREGVYKSHNALITAFCEATWTLVYEAVAHRQFAPVFVFDRGFARAQYVLAPLIAKGIPFVMRVPRNVSVKTENGWCRVDTLPTRYQADVLYQKTQKLPVTLAVHRDAAFDDPMVLISTHAKGGHLYQLYKRRMQIEHGFRDIKSTFGFGNLVLKKNRKTAHRTPVSDSHFR